MKVRRKENGEVFEVLEESPNYYLVQAKPFTPFTFKKDSCEPIPEERWGDVTAQSGVYGDSKYPCLGIAHSTDPIYQVYPTPHADLKNRYRLRKIEVEYESEDGPAKRWAFIIEKKET